MKGLEIFRLANIGAGRLWRCVAQHRLYLFNWRARFSHQFSSSASQVMGRNIEQTGAFCLTALFVASSALQPTPRGVIVCAGHGISNFELMFCDRTSEMYYKSSMWQTGQLRDTLQGLNKSQTRLLATASRSGFGTNWLVLFN